MDLTKVLSRDVWSDVLANLNIFKDIVPILNSYSIIQETLLDNVQHGRYKQPTKIEGVSWRGNKTEEWYLDGELHREYTQGPALIVRHPNGHVIENWLENGKETRLDGPTIVHLSPNGIKEMEEWRLGGKIHRDGSKPAKSYWYPDGTKQLERWYQNDQKHRFDGPASIEWNVDGMIVGEFWFLNNISILPPTQALPPDARIPPITIPTII